MHSCKMVLWLIRARELFELFYKELSSTPLECSFACGCVFAYNIYEADLGSVIA